MSNIFICLLILYKEFHFPFWGVPIKNLTSPFGESQVKSCISKINVLDLKIVKLILIMSIDYIKVSLILKVSLVK